MAKYDTTLYDYARTNDIGEVKFTDTLYFPDTAYITVTGRNLLPSSDTIISARVGEAHLVYRNHLVLDTIGGNGNYQPNNGEDIELAVWVINIGDTNAQNVSGILQKVQADNYYQLSDTIKFFGDIASFDSAFTSNDGFNVVIDQYCPDSHEIKLKLTCRDTEDSVWVSYLNLLVYSPRPYMIYKSHAIVDTLGGNGNYQVNPGEDIELPTWVQNIGDSIAENVYAIMQKKEPDQYYFLADTIKYFGDILPSDSVWTTADGFNVLVDSSCPDSHEIKLQITIKDSLDSLWIYDFSITNHAPGLEFHSYLVNNSNKYIMHGDTANLVVYIRNCGSSTAENLTGTLISNDTLVTVIDGNAIFDSIPPEFIGSNGSNPFVITANPATPPGYSTNLELALSAGVYQDTVSFEIYIGQRDYLVWDPDPNHSSGAIIHSKLAQLSFLGDYLRAFPYEYLDIYKTLFTCVGMFPDNYIIYDTSIVAIEIVRFLNAGGKMYLEGGDVWYYDPTNGGYNFCPRFRITPISNNIGLFTGVVGVDSTFTRQMNFDYSGENFLIDRINPFGTGQTVLRNAFNDYSIGVAANHQTIGVSIELNGLVDASPPSTKIILIDSIMHYFRVEPSGTEEYNLTSPVEYFMFEIYPNPFKQMTNIRIQIPANSLQMTDNGLQIKIFDVSGRLVKTVSRFTLNALRPTLISWDGTDACGRVVAQGVYFIQLEAGELKKTKKVILLK
jgi:hypothetical protein